MKSIISGALAAGLVAVCLTLNVQAKSVTPLKTSTVAVSDTGKMDKMAKGKKMDKMSNKKADKMDKMSKDKMSGDKMGKKKMSKDTASKM